MHQVYHYRPTAVKNEALRVNTLEGTRAMRQKAHSTIADTCPGVGALCEKCCSPSISLGDPTFSPEVDQQENRETALSLVTDQFADRHGTYTPMYTDACNEFQSRTASHLNTAKCKCPLVDTSRRS